MFLRAHGEEQKQQRVQQIMAATSELYNEIGYDKVTFSKIAKKLDFSRINLYNYFSCKEDIFLLILVERIQELVKDAMETFSQPSKDLETFISDWAELMLRHQQMLSLFSIVNTTILHDASLEAHKSFRRDMNLEYKKLYEVVRIALPQLNEEQAACFIDSENSFAITLYSASLEYKEAHNIPVFENVGYGTRHFIPQFIPFLRVTLRGLLAE